MNNNNNTNQGKEVNILNSVNVLIGALEIAQKNGTYTLEQSAEIYNNIKVLKLFFEKLVQEQKNKTEIKDI
jgi:hypothetical protein